jgi:hypothetical protein
MPRSVLTATVLIIVIYAVVCSSCALFYKLKALEPGYALLYSIDTITCSARYPTTKPKDEKAGREEPLPPAVMCVAACEALFGHLGFPLFLAYLFANCAAPRPETAARKK